MLLAYIVTVYDISDIFVTNNNDTLLQILLIYCYQYC